MQGSALLGCAAHRKLHEKSLPGLSCGGSEAECCNKHMLYFMDFLI